MVLRIPSALLVVTAFCFAQIQSNVNVVLIPTTVLDRQGNFVNGLGEHDFVVLDNGTPRSYQMDSASDLNVPLSVVIAIGTGAPAAAALAKLKKTSSMFQPLILGDRGDMAVVTFNREVRVAQDFTTDPNLTGKAFRALKSSSSDDSIILDAMYKCEEMLASHPGSRRKVILLISESRDRGSKAKLEGILATAQREGIAIYPATYSAYATPFTAKPSDLPPPSGGGFDILGMIIEGARLGKMNLGDALSKGTGGEHLSFLTLKSLEKLISRLGEGLHSQYLISFRPADDTPAGHHDLQITVRDHPEYVIHARPAYWWGASL